MLENQHQSKNQDLVIIKHMTSISQMFVIEYLVKKLASSIGKADGIFQSFSSQSFRNLTNGDMPCCEKNVKFLPQKFVFHKEGFWCILIRILHSQTASGGEPEEPASIFYNIIDNVAG